MPTEFQLLQVNKTSGTLYAVASFLIIFIANWSQAILLQQQSDDHNSTRTQDPSNITPTKLTLLTYAIAIIGSSLSLFAAKERLKQRQINQSLGKDTASLSPNLFITAGVTLSLIGLITAALGVKQRVDQEAQITNK